VVEERAQRGGGRRAQRGGRRARRGINFYHRDTEITELKNFLNLRTGKIYVII
jgi:hypothetical protein